LAQASSDGHFIVDSSMIGFGALAAQHHHCLDLAWARLAPWRRALGAAFEPAPRQSLLAGLEHLRINVAGTRRELAWLFVGWLGSRLGWGSGHLADSANGHSLQITDGPLIELVEVGSDSQSRHSDGETVSLVLSGANESITAYKQPGVPYAVFESSREGVAWRSPLPSRSPSECLAWAYQGQQSQSWRAAFACLLRWGLAQ
jgi:glucose-6-phosphate dehydrogenase assembly protein OpcA